MEEEETDDDLSQSKDINDVFEDSREEIEDVKHKIFVFARTDRQKEDWWAIIFSNFKHNSSIIFLSK